MRTIRRKDPQSGIVSVKEITLISNAGATSTRYEELPPTDNQIANAANQMTEAVQDVRKTLSESNIIQYNTMNLMQSNNQVMQENSEKEYEESLKANALLNEKLAYMIETNGAHQTNQLDMLQEIAENINDLALINDFGLSNISTHVSDTQSEISNAIKSMDNIGGATEEIGNTMDDILGEMSSRKIDISDAVVTINDEEKTMKELFSNILTVLEDINTRLAAKKI